MVTALLGLCASLVWLVRVPIDPLMSLRTVVASEELAAVETLQDPFAGARGILLVLVEGDAPAADRCARFEAALSGVAGVSWTWSADTRPRLVLEPGPEPGLRVLHGPARRAAGHTRPTTIDAFLAPDPGTRVLIAGLDADAVEPRRSLEFSARLEKALRAVSHPGESFTAVGEPTIRAAAAKMTARDVRWMVPLLVVVVVAVPWMLFRKVGAALVPVVVAGTSTAFTLLAARLGSGGLGSETLVLVPFVWAIATLDAMHLYGRRAVFVRHGRADPEHAAIRALWRPCLVTSATTMVGLLVLAYSSAAPALRVFGLWGSLGTGLAYAITFLIGPALVRRLAPAHIDATHVRKMAALAQRHPLHTAALWLVVVAVGGTAATGLETRARYPALFAEDEQAARDLAHVADRLDAEPAPLEFYLQAGPHAKAEEVVRAMTLLQYRLERLPEVRLVLSPGLLVRELVRDDPTVLQRVTSLDGVARTVVEEPAIARLWSAEAGIARGVALLRPAGAEQRKAAIDAVLAATKELPSGMRVRMGGPGYFYERVHRQSLIELGRGLGATVALVFALLAVVLPRRRLLAAALAGNLVPLVVVAGVMAAAGIPWTVGLVAVPIVLVAVAVDDTVHLLWPLRDARRPTSLAIAKALRQAGPAVVATTLVLCACLAIETGSGFRLPREIGLLVPCGLAVALACDLTLIPALVALTRRHAPGRRRAPPEVAVESSSSQPGGVKSSQATSIASTASWKKPS